MRDFWFLSLTKTKNRQKLPELLSCLNNLRDEYLRQHDVLIFSFQKIQLIYLKRFAQGFNFLCLCVLLDIYSQNNIYTYVQFVFVHFLFQRDNVAMHKTSSIK